MESTITPLTERGDLWVAVKGDITAASLVEVLHELSLRLDQGDVPIPLNVLWDGRAIVSLAISPEDMPALSKAIEHLAPWLGGGRSAILHGGAQVNPELMGRLLAARAPKGERSRAFFTDFDAAVAWMTDEDGGS